jgi:hypothetical protein
MNKLFLFLCLMMVIFSQGSSHYWVAEAEGLNAPKNVGAWHSGRYIQLRWDVILDDSIIKYNIYISIDLKTWHKLNPFPFPFGIFVDYYPPSDEVFYYKVTAVDINGNESPTSLPVKVKSTYVSQKRSMRSSAIAFDKNDIISDQHLLNSSTMTLQQIQEFMASHNSVLANYSARGKTAAQQIYDECQTYGINPYIVLTTLQKEQSLITSKTASQQQLDWAMGWGNPSNFSDQIKYGTRQFKLYYNNLGNYLDVAKVPWSVGQPHTVFDGTITPANTATAGLYIYTPWIGEGGGGRAGIGGNYLFWDLWYNQFQFKSKEISIRIDTYTANPRQVAVEQSTTLNFSFTNTGNTQWTFGAAATLKKPDGIDVNLPIKPVTLNPQQQGSAQWTYTIDMAGSWNLIFGVWQESALPVQNPLGNTGWLAGYISATPTSSQTFTLSLSKGWNMVSIPGAPTDNSIANLVQGKPILSSVYTLDTNTVTFKLVSTIDFGGGYLMAARQNTELSIPYQPKTSLTRQVKKGWNMVGSVSTAVSTNQLSSSPPNAVLSSIVFGLNPATVRFEPANTIQPGRGYLVAATQDATLMMNVQAAPSIQPQNAVLAQQPSWQSILEIQTPSQSQALTFGMHSSASAEFDGLDIPLPPTPMWFSDGFQASWINKDTHFSQLSRAVQRESSHAVWQLSVELPEQGKLHWRHLPPSYRSTIGYDGQFIVMQPQQYIILPAGKHQLTVALDAFDSLPKQTQLLANYPNPFNPETWIPYHLAEESDVTLTIYDQTGREVRRLYLHQQLAGDYTDKGRAIYWNGRNQVGEPVSSGVYFYTLQTKGFSQTRKLAIIR